MKTFLNVGDIFSQRSRYSDITSYWKVTSIDEKGWLNQWDYRVIRCSKTGKEFKDVNEFSTNIDRFFTGSKDAETFAVFTVVKRATEVGTKADIDKGIEIGKVKRRIQYLENKIDRYGKELERLKLGAK